MTLNSRINLGVLAELSNQLDLSAAAVPLSYAKSIPLLNGTGANQADKVFQDSNSIAASSTTSLDLAGGGLTDALNNSLTFVKLKAVIVYAEPTNTNNVVVTRPASNGVPLFSAAGDACPVLPGGTFVWVAPGAGVTVTAGTGDLLDLVNSGAGSAVDYDIVLLGTSA
ncbi:hypothetical protein [Saccharothrix sp. HUAS TT1]|uniref:hypothetical protein n=1 Tax=unclassified Saccharothrix TaxID=2593673 RepID=UPI00345B5A2F